jgi:tetratricopeptide (TPR) repeat protein
MTDDRDAILAGTDLLVRTGRYTLAIAEFERFVHEQPGAWPMAAMLADLFRRAGETAAAEGRSAEAIAYFDLVAKWRAVRGDRLGAEELRARVAVLEADHAEAEIEVARIVAAPAPAAVSEFIRPRRDSVSPAVREAAARARDAITRGNAVEAADHLTVEMADDDPSTLLTMAEVMLRGGQLDRGIALADRAMTVDRGLADAVAQLGSQVARRQPDAGSLLVEMAEVIRTQDAADRAAKSA